MKRPITECVILIALFIGIILASMSFVLGVKTTLQFAGIWLGLSAILAGVTIGIAHLVKA